MFIGKFKSNHPFTILLLILVGVMLWADGFLFYKHTPVLYENVAPLYGLVEGFVKNSPFISLITSFVIMVLQAFMLNKVITDKNLIDRNSFLPALFYMVLMSSSFNLFGLHPVWFANFFVIISINKIFDVFNEDDVFLEIFNVGFLLSIASLFYQPAIWYIIIVIGALITYYLFNIRGILASLIGFVTPYLFVSLYYFWFDMLPEKSESFLQFFQIIDFRSLHITNYGKLSIAFFAIISIFLIAKIHLGSVTDKTIRIRKRLQVVLILFFTMIASVLFAGEFISIHHGVIMLPLAVYCSVFFQQNRTPMYNEIFFTIFLIVILLGKLVRLD